MVGSDVAKATGAVLLQNLIGEYFRELDTTGGVNAFQFFSEDGSLDVGHMSLHGHEEMKEFYAKLVAQSKAHSESGERTTRHIYTNLIIDFQSDDAATMAFIAINFSADRPAPVAGSISPTVIADIRCDCRRNGEGEWRIFSLSGSPAFIGGDSFQEKVLMGQ